MSDRPARPEWRAAYLNRTLTRRAARTLRVTPALRDTASGAVGRPTATREATRRHPVPVGSLPLSIAAMLRLVPSP
jgi:hypothetical protein